MNEQEYLQHIYQLIKARKFEDARLLLKKIPQHPTAQQWLQKLNEIAPEQKVSSNIVPISAHTETTTLVRHVSANTPKVNSPTIGLPIYILTLVLAGILVVVAFVVGRVSAPPVVRYLGEVTTTIPNPPMQAGSVALRPYTKSGVSISIPEKYVNVAENPSHPFSKIGAANGTIVFASPLTESEMALLFRAPVGKVFDGVAGLPTFTPEPRPPFNGEFVLLSIRVESEIAGNEPVQTVFDEEKSRIQGTLFRSPGRQEIGGRTVHSFASAVTQDAVTGINETLVFDLGNQNVGVLTGLLLGPSASTDERKTTFHALMLDIVTTVSFDPSQAGDFACSLSRWWKNQGKIVIRFLDATELASKTARGSLSTVILDMQSAHREFEQQNYPSCAKEVRDLLVAGMRDAVQGYQDFVGKNDVLQEIDFENAEKNLKAAYEKAQEQVVFLDVRLSSPSVFLW